MSIVNLFGTKGDCVSESDNAKKFSEKIFENVSRLRTESKFIKISDTEVLFGGTTEKPTFVMKVFDECIEGEKSIYVSVNDRVWHERDYENEELFEEALTEYIAARADRVVKTVIEKKKYKWYRETTYYLSLNATWEIIDEYYTEDEVVCKFKADRSGYVEQTVSYALFDF